MNIRIVVASHKDYWMPEDSQFLPMQVGANGKALIHENWQRDDTGDNISVKNGTFCELTGLYWAWKNLDADYVGLMHYRRYLAGRFSLGNRKKRLATQEQIQRKLEHVDVLLPKKRRYYIETGYMQYTHAHHEIDLLETKSILQERYPEYLPAWESTMASTSGHRFNLFVMERTLLNRYCEWLFDVLFELEKRLDITDYTGTSYRVFGLISERLLDIWLETNRISYTELPVVHLESQHWPRKALMFLRRKFCHKETAGIV